MREEFGEGGEGFPGEPGGWRPPMRCPQCHQMETHFVTLRYEMSVYECELCGMEFEVEEGD